MPLSQGLAIDSRQMREGALFAALPGSRVHGAEFVTYALRMGAAAILTDREGAEIASEVLADSKCRAGAGRRPARGLAAAAALWFGAQPETMVAVTGTNGKTSVASFHPPDLGALGHEAANIGTTGIEGAFSAPLAHTTPDPMTLHRLLAEMARRGRDPCRDGGIQPRAGPAPAGRGAAARSGLYQPDAGSSGLSRHDGRPISPPKRSYSTACCPMTGLR
jgi:UDP-N-acetylmuramyl tripeptide synthase